LAYVVADLIENATVLAMLNRYPDRLSGLAIAVPYLTVLKRAASLLAIVLPLAMLGIAKAKERRRNSAVH